MFQQIRNDIVDKLQALTGKISTQFTGSEFATTAYQIPIESFFHKANNVSYGKLEKLQTSMSQQSFNRAISSLRLQALTPKISAHF